MQVKNKKFYIHTLGCRVNLLESNNINNQFLKAGAIKTDNCADADICIVNTCFVTNKAGSKSKNIISRFSKMPKCKLVVVCGCYSQSEYKNIEGNKVGVILGTKDKTKIISLVKKYKSEKIQKIENQTKNNKFEEINDSIFCDNTRAFIKIQDGCNFFCSYCLIPFLRGRQRSLSHIKIINNIKKLIKNGYKEIVLTGVNTSGYEDKNKYTFLNLLNDIDNIDGNFRVRISSLEPFQINKKIIDLITANKER
jgi:threonylcarbamoyladenosine tRNA methylthiotransferase MtaB